MPSKARPTACMRVEFTSKAAAQYRLAFDRRSEPLCLTAVRLDSVRGCGSLADSRAAATSLPRLPPCPCGSLSSRRTASSMRSTNATRWCASCPCGTARSFLRSPTFPRRSALTVQQRRSDSPQVARRWGDFRGSTWRRQSVRVVLVAPVFDASSAWWL